MPTTCKLIASSTLGSNAAGIEFTNIPGTYTDLYLVVSSRTNEGVAISDLNVYFNGTTSSPSQAGYSGRNLQGSGAAASSASLTSYVVNAIQPGSSATASTFGSSEFYIPNYSGSTNKSVSFTAVQETNGTTAYIRCGAWLWSSTAAITSLYIFPGGTSTTNLVTGSSAFLYGITRSDDNSPGTFGIQATGGDVTISGGYKYHVFNATGTFTVTEPGFVECLVIAGGGGGGGNVTTEQTGAGGGGAGGYISTVGGENSGGGTTAVASRLINKGSYAVIVGGGGSSGSNGSKGANGTDSIFASFQAIGGGAGGAQQGNFSGNTGGSGGGAGYTGSKGPGIAGQGYDGGTVLGGSFAGQGGGGAGGAGGSHSSNNGGSGGVGVASSITGTSVTRAGGGGGGAYLSGTVGAGGSGGGGAGGNNASSGAGTAGTANTGGGGGGAGGATTNAAGGNGGSGVVIIRYRVS